MEAKSPISGRRFARNLDWNLLRIFHEICNAGGITEAARTLKRKQPAISMALRRLEDFIGTRLCERGPGGFHLTQEGLMLAEICKHLFETVTSIPTEFADAHAEISGRVRIQLVSNLSDIRLDQLLRQFHNAHPSVEIFISISTWDTIPRSIMQNEVDIGIAPARVRHNSLRYSVLFKEIYRPYCGVDHPLFSVACSKPKELANFPMIHTGADEPEQLTYYRQKHGIGKKIAGLSENLEEALRLTLLGIGICFLPEAFVREHVNRGALHPLLGTHLTPSSTVYLITNPNAPRHRAREALLAMLGN